MEPISTPKTRCYFSAIQSINATQRTAKHRLPFASESTEMERLVRLFGRDSSISQLLDRHVSALSGGQQQRVAIARALAHKPKLLLADEPTGNLDQKAGLEVMKLLSEITTQGNTAVLLVTHSPECAEFMQTPLRLKDGRLQNGLAQNQHDVNEQHHEAS